jgi:hypothetical protein
MPVAGALPRRQQRLVEAWAEIHQEELMQDWTLAQQGRMLFRIEGLL